MSYNDILKTIDVITTLKQFTDNIHRDMSDNNQISCETLKDGYKNYYLGSVPYFKGIDLSNFSQDITDISTISVCLENINKDINDKFLSINKKILFKTKQLSDLLFKRLSDLSSTCNSYITEIEKYSSKEYSDIAVKFISIDNIKQVLFLMIDSYKWLFHIKSKFKQILFGDTDEFRDLLQNIDDLPHLKAINFFIEDKSEILTCFPDYDILKQNVTLCLTPDIQSDTVKHLGWSNQSFSDVTSGCLSLCDKLQLMIMGFTSSIDVLFKDVNSLGDFYNLYGKTDDTHTLKINVRYKICFELINQYFMISRIITNNVSLCVNGCLNSFIKLVLHHD